MLRIAIAVAVTPSFTVLRAQQQLAPQFIGRLGRYRDRSGWTAESSLFSSATEPRPSGPGGGHVHCAVRQLGCERARAGWSSPTAARSLAMVTSPHPAPPHEAETRQVSFPLGQKRAQGAERSSASPRRPGRSLRTSAPGRGGEARRGGTPGLRAVSLKHSTGRRQVLFRPENHYSMILAGLSEVTKAWRTSSRTLTWGPCPALTIPAAPREFPMPREAGERRWTL